MFYFASDNPLAPSVVSQLKALKNAGFHPDANVVARFDPHTVGTPTHTFDFNIFLKKEALAALKALGGPKVLDTLKTSHRLEDPAKEKIRKKLNVPDGHQVGFRPDDPFIRNLVFDKLWGDATVLKNGGEEEKINDCIGRILTSSVEHQFVQATKKQHTNGGRASGLPRGVVVEFDPPNPDKIDSQVETSGGVKTKNTPGVEGSTVRKKTSGEAGHENGSGAAAKKVREAEIDPKQALDEFLQFCAKNYPARHYMLFVLGHGLIVGNDMFLLDEHAKKPTLSLTDLDEVLGNFDKAINDKALNKDIKKGDPKRELSLIAFHACSMSSIEVAYQLQGKARYMLASQGPEFVGSLPYTQILIRVFNDLVDGANDIECTVTKIFNYCFYNSYDFQMAGYSFDLCLCDLEGMSKTKDAIKNLTSEL
ncbi:MAG: hypothetical protein DMF65_01560, partial [Acidobacteria bacterium]